MGGGESQRVEYIFSSFSVLLSSPPLAVSNRLFCPHLSALARSLSSYLCDSATLRSFLLLLIHSRGSQMTTWSDAARCLLKFCNYVNSIKSSGLPHYLCSITMPNFCLCLWCILNCLIWLTNSQFMDGKSPKIS